MEWTGLGGKAAVGSARGRGVPKAGKRHSFPPGCAATEGQDCRMVVTFSLRHGEFGVAGAHPAGDPYKAVGSRKAHERI